MRFVIYNHALLHKNPFPRVMKFTISVEHSLLTVNILSLSAREENINFTANGSLEWGHETYNFSSPSYRFLEDWSSRFDRTTDDRCKPDGCRSSE